MIMNEMAQQFIDAFSSNSMSTIICIIIVLIIIGCIFGKGIKKLASCISIVVAGLFLMQIFHIFAYYTDLGTVLPFTKTVFKWDILTMIVSPFSGTKAADVCMQFEAWLIIAAQKTADFVEWLIGIMEQMIGTIFPSN